MKRLTWFIVVGAGIGCAVDTSPTGVDEAAIDKKRPLACYAIRSSSSVNNQRGNSCDDIEVAIRGHAEECTVKGDKDFYDELIIDANKAAKVRCEQYCDMLNCFYRYDETIQCEGNRFGLGFHNPRCEKDCPIEQFCQANINNAFNCHCTSMPPNDGGVSDADADAPSDADADVEDADVDSD